MRPLLRQLGLICSLAALMLCAFLLPPSVPAQELEPHKAGVVRIRNNKFNETGTGFILKVDADRAYVVTAAHVVRNDGSPSVYFFNRPNDAVPAALIDAEADNTKGIALLEVKASKETLKGLAPLKLSNYLAKGGEPVSVIGFPDGIATPSVVRANVSRLEGRHLVFDRPVAGGTSGGPVLYEGRVIGLVTETTEESAYAVRAENIPIYVGGINKRLADSLRESTQGQVLNSISPEGVNFCRALNQIIDSSRNDFSSIVKTEGSTGFRDVLVPSVTLPGTHRSIIDAALKYFSAKVKSDHKYDGSVYHKYISMMKVCLPEWKQTESSTERPGDGGGTAVIKSVLSRTYRFTESDKGVVAEVHQFKDTDETYHSNITVYAPNSPREKRALLSLGEEEARSILNYISDEEGAAKVCQAILKLVEASHGDFYSIVKPTGEGGVFNSTVEVPEFPAARVSPRDNVRFAIHADGESEQESLYYRLVATLGRCLKGWKRNQNAVNSNTARAGWRYYRFFEDQNGAVVEISYLAHSPDMNHILYLSIYSPNSPTRPKLTN